jgi:hypothetical protein
MLSAGMNMTSVTAPFHVGQTLIGPLFNEPMRVGDLTADQIQALTEQARRLKDSSKD